MGIVVEKRPTCNVTGLRIAEVEARKSALQTVAVGSCGINIQRCGINRQRTVLCDGQALKGKQAGKGKKKPVLHGSTITCDYGAWPDTTVKAAALEIAPVAATVTAVAPGESAAGTLNVRDVPLAFALET